MRQRARALDGLELGLMLLDHPAVMVGRQRGQPLGQQIVAGVTGRYFNFAADNSQRFYGFL